MTEKTKTYRDVKFPYEIISEAATIFYRLLGSRKKKKVSASWKIEYPEVDWKFENEEQFRAEYIREEITSATLHLICLEPESTFYVTYDKGSEKSSTRVAIKLSRINDIEKIFSVFDTHYEQVIKALETKLAAKEPEIPLPEYKRESILPSTLVDIKTIANLEKYIAQRVSQLDLNKKPTLPELDFFSPSYKLTIVDSQGTLKMDNMSSFSKDIFDNDTSSINLNYGKLLGSNSLEIDVTFTPNRYSSKLKISYKGENARDVVESIKIGIFNILKENKTNHSFYHTQWSQSLLNVLISVALLLSLQPFFTGKQSWVPFITVLPISFLFSFTVPLLKPYSVFDSKRSRSFVGWNKWLIEAILAAFVGWVLFTLIIPNVFP